MAQQIQMDRPSVMFAHILDNIMVESETDSMARVLVCQTCRDYLCEVEDGDTVRVLLNTALAHECKG